MGNDLRHWITIVEARKPRHPDILYHHSSPESRASIQQYGLLRSKSETAALAKEYEEEDWESAGGIFFASKPLMTPRADVWQVDVRGLSLVPDDTTKPTSVVHGGIKGDRWWVTYAEDVPPDRLTLIHRGAEATGGAALSEAATIDSPAFRRWFGGSKVVDQAGKPLMVFHGTGESFSAFDLRSHRSTDAGMLGGGIYFDTDPKLASAYARGNAPNVIAAYISLQRPFEFTVDVDALWQNNGGAWKTLALLDALKARHPHLSFAGVSLDDLTEHDINADRGAIAKDIRRLVQRAGYDGVIMTTTTGAKEVVAYSPQQVTSAVSDPASYGASTFQLGEAVSTGGANDLRTEVEAFRKQLEERVPGLELWISVGPSRDLHISQIVVPKEQRSSGIGTQVMQALTAFADRHGLVMTLSPDNSYGGSITRLRRFYPRFGFRPNRGRRKDFRFSDTMIRRPEAATVATRLSETWHIRFVPNDSDELAPTSAAEYKPKSNEIVIRERYRNNRHLRDHEIGHALLEPIQPLTWAAALQDDPQAWQEFLSSSVARSYQVRHEIAGEWIDNPMAYDWIEAGPDLYMLDRAGKLHDAPHLAATLHRLIAKARSLTRE